MATTTVPHVSTPATAGKNPDLGTPARIAHEANRVFCESIGDKSQLPWEHCEQWQRDSAIEGVRTIVNNPSITPQQTHEAWMRHKEIDGWKFGEKKDAEAKTHPCMVPYAELSKNNKVKDHLFGAVVRAYFFLPQVPYTE